MQFILLIAGLVLLLAVSAPWAAVAGWVCLGVFAVVTLLQIIAMAVVLWASRSF